MGLLFLIIVAENYDEVCGRLRKRVENAAASELRVLCILAGFVGLIADC
jgi:hypothetical protein